MKTFNLIFTLLFLFVSFSNADVLGTKTQGPALIEGFNEIASAAGTTTLTKDSQTKQILTGTSTQTFVLPDATTIPLSRRFLIINKSTGTATIQTSGGGALTIISAGLQKEFHLRAAGSAAGTWDVLEGGGSGGAWGGITGTLADQTDLQTALNAKAPLASPTFTGAIGTPLTASRALVTDGSGNLSASSTTSTALGYLDVSSSLTTLLAAKAPTASPTFTGTIGTPLTASKLLATDASGNLTATAANSSQATYLDFTSSGQTQLDAKQARSTLTTKGDLYVATASATVARQGIGSDGQVLTADSAQTNGLKWATPASAPDSSFEISNCSLATSVAGNALTVALKDASGSDPSAGSPCKIGFRNATLSTGTYAQISTTSAVSVVVSSGSTLGHSNGAADYIHVYAINNAGTVELALSSALFVDPGTTLSTTAEGGAGAADSRSTIYSTTARSNVAVRHIGRILITEATAGTWASNATTISLNPFALNAPSTNSTILERIERARITGACTIVSQSGSWLSISGTGSGSGCTLTIASGLFSVAPACVLTSEHAATASSCRINGSPTTTSVAVNCFVTNTAGNDDAAFGVICMGPR